MNRKRFSKGVETEVLTKCRRRCALCFCLDGDTSEKEGQIAHIDRNPSNATLANAAFMCTKHHARYDSYSKQTKGFKLEEVKFYQSTLYESLALPGSWPDARRSKKHRAIRRSPSVGISLEVYERRIPVYRTVTQFIRAVVKDLKPRLPEIFKFAYETEEALFLFDESIAEYLDEIFSQAVRLHTVSVVLTRPGHRETLPEEETKLALWFTEQYKEIRTRFAPFLRLA
jgi:hypothetical protein